MKNTINTIASIFTGKGGTMKLAILLSLVAAGFIEMMDSGYSLKANTRERSFSLTPESNVDNQHTQTDQIYKDFPEQELISTAVADEHTEYNLESI